MDLDNFERAFSDGTAGCRRQCCCGHEFYNPDDSWDWEDGEIESLETGDAIAKDYSIGGIVFEGREYVNACDCWHERANQIMAFIDYNDKGIADYLNLERERKISEANTVKAVGV